MLVLASIYLGFASANICQYAVQVSWVRLSLDLLGWLSQFKGLGPKADPGCWVLRRTPDIKVWPTDRNRSNFPMQPQFHPNFV